MSTTHKDTASPDIAHTLRTPLSSIFGYIQLLETRALPAKEREWLTKMREQCMRLDALIMSHLSSSE